MSNIKALKYQRWAILWTLLILVLCNIDLSSGSSVGFFFTGFDKLAHLGFFLCAYDIAVLRKDKISAQL